MTIQILLKILKQIERKQFNNDLDRDLLFLQLPFVNI